MKKPCPRVERLNAAWLAFEERTGKRKREVALELGMSPTNFAEYLSGANKLHVGFVLKFCLATDTNPLDIDQDLKAVAELFARHAGAENLGIDHEQKAATRELAAVSADQHRAY